MTSLVTKNNTREALSSVVRISKNQWWNVEIWSTEHQFLTSKSYTDHPKWLARHLFVKGVPWNTTASEHGLFRGVLKKNVKKWFCRAKNWSTTCTSGADTEVSGHDPCFGTIHNIKVYTHLERVWNLNDNGPVVIENESFLCRCSYMIHFCWKPSKTTPQ